MSKQSSSEKQEGVPGLPLPCPGRGRNARKREQRKRKWSQNMGGEAGRVGKEKRKRRESL